MIVLVKFQLLAVTACSSADSELLSYATTLLRGRCLATLSEPTRQCNTVTTRRRSHLERQVTDTTLMKDNGEVSVGGVWQALHQQPRGLGEEKGVVVGRRELRDQELIGYALFILRWQQLSCGQLILPQR